MFILYLFITMLGMFLIRNPYRNFRNNFQKNTLSDTDTQPHPNHYDWMSLLDYMEKGI